MAGVETPRAEGVNEDMEAIFGAAQHGHAPDEHAEAYQRSSSRALVVVSTSKTARRRTQRHWMLALVMTVVVSAIIFGAYRLAVRSELAPPEIALENPIQHQIGEAVQPSPGHPASLPPPAEIIPVARIAIPEVKTHQTKDVTPWRGSPERHGRDTSRPHERHHREQQVSISRHERRSPSFHHLAERCPRGGPRAQQCWTEALDLAHRKLTDTYERAVSAGVDTGELQRLRGDWDSARSESREHPGGTIRRFGDIAKALKRATDEAPGADQ